MHTRCRPGTCSPALSLSRHEHTYRALLPPVDVFPVSTVTENYFAFGGEYRKSLSAIGSDARPFLVPSSVLTGKLISFTDVWEDAVHVRKSRMPLEYFCRIGGKLIQGSLRWFGNYMPFGSFLSMANCHDLEDYVSQ
ncbi:hypothetical protein KM043_009869 [Ampulex compressa]|nr:hypothetical protein KM043_009869 [Ampulex compressa]